MGKNVQFRHSWWIIALFTMILFEAYQLVSPSPLSSQSQQNRRFAPESPDPES